MLTTRVSRLRRADPRAARCPTTPSCSSSSRRRARRTCRRRPAARARPSRRCRRCGCARGPSRSGRAPASSSRTARRTARGAARRRRRRSAARSIVHGSARSRKRARRRSCARAGTPRRRAPFVEEMPVHARARRRRRCPGATARCRSAERASGVVRGSMTTSVAPRFCASRTIRHEVDAGGRRVHAPEHDERRVRVVLVGDRRHLAVERHVRRAGRRRADRAREARRAEAPEQLRVEVVLRQQAVRAAVGERQDRLAARIVAFAARHPFGDELERFVPRHARELAVALAPLADARDSSRRSGPYTRSSNLRTFAQM